MNQLFANILYAINSLIQNYGWSMVIFTVLMKLLVMPLGFKSRKSMRRMTALQPEIAKLQKRYANDQQKLNQKMQALYSKANVSPLSGCLPMLISMVILIIMFGAMRFVANENIAAQTLHFIATGEQETINESWLWIKNIWMPDSPFVPYLAQNANTLTLIDASIWQSALTNVNAEWLPILAEKGIDAATINGNAVFSALQQMPEWVALASSQVADGAIALQIPTGLFGTWNIFKAHNGLFILPVLACATQFLMTATQPQQPQTEGQAGTGKFMKYFFPLITLFFCLSYNAAFALYWVISNVYAWIENLAFNYILEKQDQKQESAAIEEEGIK